MIRNGPLHLFWWCLNSNILLGYIVVCFWMLHQYCDRKGSTEQGFNRTWVQQNMLGESKSQMHMGDGSGPGLDPEKSHSDNIAFCCVKFNTLVLDSFKKSTVRLTVLLTQQPLFLALSKLHPPLLVPCLIPSHGYIQIQEAVYPITLIRGTLGQAAERNRKIWPRLNFKYHR